MSRKRKHKSDVVCQEIEARPTLAVTPQGFRIIKISAHAIERYCERKGVDPEEAWRRILILAAGGHAIQTPSGPALRIGYDYLGFFDEDGAPGCIVIVTYYIMTMGKARRDFIRSVRVSGLGDKAGRYRARKRYATNMRFAHVDWEDGALQETPRHHRRRPFVEKYGRTYRADMACQWGEYPRHN